MSVRKTPENERNGTLGETAGRGRGEVQRVDRRRKIAATALCRGERRQAREERRERETVSPGREGNWGKGTGNWEAGSREQPSEECAQGTGIEAWGGGSAGEVCERHRPARSDSARGARGGDVAARYRSARRDESR